MASRVIATLPIAILLGACSTDPVPPGGCVATSDCEAGHVCVSPNCIQLCTSDTGCDEGVCNNGQCGAGTRAVPEITEVRGNGSAADVFADALILIGSNFDGAAVTLDGGGLNENLTVRTAQSDQIEAVLPMGVTDGGTYSLVVTNAAGAAQASVQVLRGETGPAGAPQTPASVLMMLVTVDGPGSSLDADTVDGQHASAFQSAAIPMALGMTGATAPSATVAVGGNLTRQLSGTVGILQGTVDVVGTSTDFLAELRVGAALEIEGELYTVASIPAADSLTVDRMATVTAGGADAYTDGDLLALTNAAGDTRVTIASDGRLGINDSTPDATVHAATPGCCYSAMFERLSPRSYVRVGHGGGGAYHEYDINDGGSRMLVGIDDLTDDKFKISSNLGTEDWITVEATGNVGIRNTTPQTELDVNGYMQDDSRFRNVYTNVSTANSTPLLGRDGAPLPGNFVGMFYCAITGTGVAGMSSWMVKRTSIGPAVFIDQVSGNQSSNTPEIYDNGGVVTLRLFSHTSLYTVNCLTDRIR